VIVKCRYIHLQKYHDGQLRQGVVVITSYRKTAKLCWKRAHWLILNIIGEKIKGKMYKLSIIINSKSDLLEQQLSYLFFLYPNWYTFLDHFLLMQSIYNVGRKITICEPGLLIYILIGIRKKERRRTGSKFFLVTTLLIASEMS
jgi:hypothetical protein